MTITKLASAAILAGLVLAAVPESARADEYCREYTRLVQIGGRTEEAYGTACLEPDGAWRIRNEDLGQGYNAPVPVQQYYDVEPERVVYVDSGPQIVFVDRSRYYRPRTQYNSGYNFGVFYSNKNFHHDHRGKSWSGRRSSHGGHRGHHR